MSATDSPSDVFSADFVLHDDLMDLEVEESLSVNPISANPRTGSKPSAISTSSAAYPASAENVFSVTPAGKSSDSCAASAAFLSLATPAASDDSTLPASSRLALFSETAAAGAAGPSACTSANAGKTHSFELVQSSARLSRFIPVKILCEEPDGSYVRAGYTFTGRVMRSPIAGFYGNYVRSETGEK